MKKIADISHYQGEVNWDKAREELELVIFRASVGSNPDKKYLEYTAVCGVPYGAYHYVKAGTAEDARTEARFFVECANKAAIKPLFYIADIEYEAQTKNTTEAVCVAFLDELRKLVGDVKIGMYINTRYKWAGAAIDMCDIMWIPRWGKNDGNIPGDQYKPDEPYDLWQYTSEGTLAGVKGDVDLNQMAEGRTLEFFIGAGTTEPERSENSMFTNLQLVAYMLNVYAKKWVYWYGTCGYECTESLLTRKSKQYPSHYGSSRTSGYKADIADGKMCADCVGVIKSFFWKGGDLNGKNVYQSNNCPDRSANGLFGMCEETGKINTIPDIPGLVVWRSGHIGVYVGNGYTVELKGFSYDCVKQKVEKGTWTHWGKLPASMLTYVDGDVEVTKPVTYKLGDRLPLKKNDEGNDVIELQAALKQLGYDLGDYGDNKDGIDGEYGSKTKAAVAELQKSAGLDETGIFDTATYKALLAALEPKENPDPDEDTPDGGSKPAYVLIIEGDENVLRLVQSAYGGTLAEVDNVIVKK